MTKETVLAAQLGARRRYAVPLALASLGVLGAFHTDLAGRFAGRPLPGGLGAALRAHPGLGLRYWWARRRASSEGGRLAAHLRFGGLFASAAAEDIPGHAAVYAFHSAALPLLAAAAKRGVPSILDQTVLPVAATRALVAEARRRLPSYASGATPEVPPEAAEFDARESAEWTAATVVVCGSEFVREELLRRGVPAAKVAVLPHPMPALTASERPAPRRGGPLRVLFLGEAGWRKGAPFLLEAMRSLAEEPVSLTLAGDWGLELPPAEALPPNCRWIGRVPHGEVPALLAGHDALCLPSLAEGSPSAVLEAAAAGLAVVTTANAGSCVEHGRTGLLVPAMDANRLAEALVGLASRPDSARGLGEALRSAAPGFHAAGRYAGALGQLLCGSCGFRSIA